MRWIGMAADGEHVTLRRFDGDFRLAEAPADPARLRHGAVLDVETTGLDRAEDEVIEIALRTFSFDRATGAVVAIEEHYDGLQEPERPVPAFVTALTGLDDEALRGQRIDWRRVRRLLDGVDVVIAHNAAFDRAFVDRALAQAGGAPRKIWACSYRQIDWLSYGFASAKLELLNVFHGFFVRSHRALADVDALLHLLTFAPPRRDDGDAHDDDEASYLAGLLVRARQPSFLVVAHGTPFELNAELRRRGYRWDRERRAWTLECAREALGPEEDWIEGQGGRPEALEISPFDRYRFDG